MRRFMENTIRHHAIPAAMRLKKKYNIELPIIEAVNKVINEGADPERTVLHLMNRDKKTELVKSVEDINFEFAILKNKKEISMKRVITYGRGIRAIWRML